MHKNGFTLLELLIAMSLLVLIIAITMGAMNLASRSMAAGEKAMESGERLRTVTAIMDAQIQSQLPLTYESEMNKVNYFRGDTHTLRLATSYSVWGGRRGYLIVDYRVQADSRGKQTLTAFEQTPGIEGTREVRLFTEASGISFEYYGKESLDEEAVWSDRWSDEIALPEAIRLRVNYGPQKLLFLFPVRTRPDTTRAPIAPFSATGGMR